jgi:hypothetical protein
MWPTIGYHQRMFCYLGTEMGRIKVLAFAAIATCLFGEVSAAEGLAFNPQVRQLTQQYARAVGQCQLHGASTEVGREACPRVDEYAKKLKVAGWEAKAATEHLFNGCSRFGSAYQLAAIARDNRQPPDTALKSLKAENWLRIEEPGLKNIINTVYFQDWAIRLLPLELAHSVEKDCRYGPDPRWKPLH